MGTRKNYIKTKFPGVYFKENKKTKVKTYLARIKINGFETEQIVGYSNDSIRTNPTIAYQKRTELVAKLKSGKSIKKGMTLDTLFEEYMLSAKAKLSDGSISVNNYNYNKYLKDKIGKRAISDIKTADIQRIINSMIDNGKSPQTAKNIKNLITPILGYAIKINYIENNVANNINLPRYDNKRRFYLPDNKAKALYKEILNIPDAQYRIMFLFLLRGRRKGEVLSLEWGDINFEAETYNIRDENSKIKENQSYMLDNELLQQLKLLKNAQNKKGLIFLSKRTGEKMSDFPRKLWAKIKINLDIDMRIHDFRHLLGFTLVNNNVPIEVISKTLGHKDIKTTQRYSNMKEEMAKEGSDAFLKLLK